MEDRQTQGFEPHLTGNLIGKMLLQWANFHQMSLDAPPLTESQLTQNCTDRVQFLQGIMSKLQSRSSNRRMFVARDATPTKQAKRQRQAFDMEQLLQIAETQGPIEIRSFLWEVMLAYDRSTPRTVQQMAIRWCTNLAHIFNVTLLQDDRVSKDFIETIANMINERSLMKKQNVQKLIKEAQQELLSIVLSEKSLVEVKTGEIIFFSLVRDIDSSEQISDSYEAINAENPARALQMTQAASKSSIPQEVLDSRVLRIFLSSTFRDMQRERTTFLLRGANQVKSFSKRKGVEVVFIDLRWGLTEEHSKNGEVLIHCLDSIKRSPYFVCFLGDRYGWVPDPQNPLEWSLETDRLYPFLREMPNRSVTEYEIQYASLRQDHVAYRSLFYFRDHDAFIQTVCLDERKQYESQPADRLNQNSLKKLIQESYQVVTYKNEIEFNDRLTEQLIHTISQDFPEPPCDEPDEVLHSRFSRSCLIGFEGRSVLLDDIILRIREQFTVARRPLMIVAKPGSGKSSIIAKLAQLIPKALPSNPRILMHFVGCGAQSATVDNIVSRFQRLHSMVRSSLESMEMEGYLCGHEDEFSPLLLANSSIQFVFLVDAINQLRESPEYPEPSNLRWLPEFSPVNLGIVVTTIEGCASIQQARDLGWDILSLPNLSTDEIQRATSNYLLRFDKRLETNQYSLILSNQQKTGRPLFLRAVLEELRTFGSYEDLTNEIKKLVSFESDVGLYCYIIRQWELRYGNPLVQSVLCSLRMSRIGLTETDLVDYIHDLHETPDLDVNWICFFSCLMDSLFLDNKRYSISNRVLQQAIDVIYPHGSPERELVYRQYCEWLLHKFSTPKDQEEFSSLTFEISWILMEWHANERLHAFMKNIEATSELLHRKDKAHFHGIWRLLESEGPTLRPDFILMAKNAPPNDHSLVHFFMDIHEHDVVVEIMEHRQKVFEDGQNKQFLKESNSILGQVYSEENKLQKALDCYLKVQKHAKDPSELAGAKNNIGLVLHKMKKLEAYEEAVTYFTEAKTLLNSVESDVSSDRAIILNNIGMTYYRLNKLAKAQEALTESHSIKVELYGESSNRCIESMINLAILFSRPEFTRVDDGAAAISHVEKAMRSAAKFYGTGKRFLLVRVKCVRILCGLKRYDLLETHYQPIMSQSALHDPSMSADLLVLDHAYARTALRLGRKREAEKALTHAVGIKPQPSSADFMRTWIDSHKLLAYMAQEQSDTRRMADVLEIPLRFAVDSMMVIPPETIPIATWLMETLSRGANQDIISHLRDPLVRLQARLQQLQAEGRVIVKAEHKALFDSYIRRLF